MIRPLLDMLRPVEAETTIQALPAATQERLDRLSPLPYLDDTPVEIRTPVDRIRHRGRRSTKAIASEMRNDDTVPMTSLAEGPHRGFALVVATSP